MKNLRSKHRTAVGAILALTVALALASCNRKTIYNHYNHTPMEGWEASDTLLFVVGSIAETALYSETIGLRTSSSYPFKELTLVVNQQIMPAGTLLSDTLRCRLTDEDGNPLAHGFNFYESAFPLRSISLNPGDSLTVRIHHYMRRELIPGIADIGVTVQKNIEANQ